MALLDQFGERLGKGNLLCHEQDYSIPCRLAAAGESGYNALGARARSSKDRAAAFEAARWEFESLRAYGNREKNKIILRWRRESFIYLR